MQSKKKRFCYRLKLFSQYFESDNWTDEASHIVSIHFQYLKDLTKKGIVFLAGRTVNEPMSDEDFGIVILETNTFEEAKNIMENDPAVKGKVMHAKLYDFSIALLRK
ncbi:MAG: YciI family protein [Bacteroidota bacterium]|nr:YciI family protein [Bacteroidota bacterium]